MIVQDRRFASRHSSIIIGVLCLLALQLSALAQPPSLAWVQRYNSPTRHVDAPAAITSDNAGNVYVTGSSLSENQFDFVTIKYSSGFPVWTNRYDGSGHGDDEPVAIAADASGNVFVTGTSSRASFALIKYSAAGAPLWTNFGTNVLAYSMIVDQAGCVIVAGDQQQGIGSNFLTVFKFSADGRNGKFIKFLSRSLMLTMSDHGKIFLFFYFSSKHFQIANYNS